MSGVTATRGVAAAGRGCSIENANRIDASTLGGDSAHTVLLLDHVRPLPPMWTDCGGRSYGSDMGIHVALDFSRDQCPVVDSYLGLLWPGKY